MTGLHALRIRLLQAVALYFPVTRIRVWLHRRRGVRIGEDVFIGMDAILDTYRPEGIWIGDRVYIGIRTTLLAHFRETSPTGAAVERHGVRVRIEDDAFIGPGVIVLPDVTVGHGAVVTAGSVVTASVAPLTMVQGNPARPVARVGVPLNDDTPIEEFYRRLRPVRRAR